MCVDTVSRSLACTLSPWPQLTQIAPDPINFQLQTIATRQDCPLLPLIFILSLESLLCAIWASQSTLGVSHKVAAYTVNLQFFLSFPHMSVPNLLAELY